MKNRAKKLLDQASQFESMKKFLEFASRETKDETKREKFLLNAKICEGMVEVCTTLAEVCEEKGN